jgi:hypothetical protein
MIKYLLLLLGYVIGVAIGYFLVAVIVDIIGDISRIRKERK